MTESQDCSDVAEGQLRPLVNKWMAEYASRWSFFGKAEFQRGPSAIAQHCESADPGTPTLFYYTPWQGMGAVVDVWDRVDEIVGRRTTLTVCEPVIHELHVRLAVAVRLAKQKRPDPSWRLALVDHNRGGKLRASLDVDYDINRMKWVAYAGIYYAWLPTRGEDFLDDCD